MINKLEDKLGSLIKDNPAHVILDGKKVGKGKPVYFIAEIGNNHNGDFFLAKRSIEEAAKAGADAVKFQKRFINKTFAKELREKPQTKGDIKGDTYGEYREGLELSFDDFVALKKVAESLNVTFFATPFDIPSVDFLEKVGIPFYKIASFDVTNLPLLDYVAQLRKPIILSVGMSSLEEVVEAVLTITKYHCDIVILHCVSIYPTPDEHINLNLMKKLQHIFKPLPIGYSGHEQDILATLVSISNGADVIERHFTLSNFLPGPDHASVSIEPKLFKEMVDSAHRIYKMYGSDKKEVFEQEKPARDKHSKSIVSLRSIPKGTIITKKMLTFKSPGYGLKPCEVDSIVGKRSKRNIKEDVVITRDDIKW